MILLGDIHGRLSIIINFVQKNDIDNENIIQVGDFGLGFDSYLTDIENLDKLNNILSKKNNKLYALKGNHDNPEFWNGHLDNKWSNIKLVKDYSILEIEGYNILFVGGAISIDRKSRLKEMQMYASKGIKTDLYWFDEEFILNTDILSNLENIDIVITHTSPDFCFPINKFGFSPIVEEYSLNDDNLKNDLLNERMLVTKMFNILSEKNNISMWFYGHFHNSLYQNINECGFKLLGIDEFYDYKGKKYEENLNNLYKQ